MARCGPNRSRFSWSGGRAQASVFLRSSPGIKRQAKQNKRRLTEADCRLVVTRGAGGGGGAKWVKGVNYTVTDGKQIFGGEHAVVYADVTLY